MIFVNPEGRVNRDMPNIALAYAATHFNVKVIDQNTMPEPRDRFLNCETDILGISVRSLTYHEAVRAAEVYKNKYPDAKVKSIHGFLDIQCCYPFVDFQDTIHYDKEFSDEYPFPNYELFDSFPVFQKNWQTGRWGYAIMTSQGCTYQCIYCASRNRKLKSRSAENCYEELRRAKDKWGIKSFVILDDCFNIDKKRVLRFCELIKPLNLKWSCANGLRADRFDEEEAQAVSESGCKYISFGIESIAPDILKTIKKGETIEQIEKAVDIAKKHMKGVSGFFIIGLPGSSYEKDLESVEWVIRKRIGAIFSYYVPFDKEIQYDEIFYGDIAKPLGDSYSKELQEKIYKMMEYMSLPPFPANILKKITHSISMAWKFDKPHIFNHLWDNSKRLIYKFAS